MASYVSLYMFLLLLLLPVLLEAAITALNICQHNFSGSGLLWGSQARHKAVTYTVVSEVCRSNLRE